MIVHWRTLKRLGQHHQTLDFLETRASLPGDEAAAKALKTCTIRSVHTRILAGAHAALESDGAAPNVWDEDFSKEFARRRCCH